MLYGASVYVQMVSLHVKPYYQPYDSDNGGAAHFMLPTREESSGASDGPWPGQPFRWLLPANNSGVPICSKAMQVYMSPIKLAYSRGIDISPGMQASCSRFTHQQTQWQICSC